MTDDDKLTTPHVALVVFGALIHALRVLCEVTAFAIVAVALLRVMFG